MWNKLTFKHKKMVAFVGCLLSLFIAYQLSFVKTIDAINLNRQLKGEEHETQNISDAYPQLENKSKAYLQALKLYTVNPDDQENRLWQAVSGIAIAKDIKISFNPISSLSKDTSTIAQHIFMNEFNFKGNYFNCVSLLDSLSKSQGIGVISTVKLSVSKDAPDQNILALKLILATRTK